MLVKEGKERPPWQSSIASACISSVSQGRVSLKWRCLRHGVIAFYCVLFIAFPSCLLSWYYACGHEACLRERMHIFSTNKTLERQFLYWCKQPLRHGTDCHTSVQHHPGASLEEYNFIHRHSRTHVHAPPAPVPDFSNPSWYMQSL